MKRIQSYLIGLALLAALCFLALIAVATTEAFIKMVLLTPTDPEAALPVFDSMTTPSYFLGMASLIASGIALLFGLRTTYLYAKDLVFTYPMVRGLEGVAFSFLASSLSGLLLILYLSLNLGGEAAILYLMAIPALFVIFLFVAALVFFLLADVVEKGRMLREENDLTI